MTDEQIKSRFAEAGDFVTRTLRCDGNTLYAYYIDGLTSGGDISEYVFRPISENLSGNLEEAYDAALHGAVYNSAVSVCEDVDALLALEPEYIVEAASVESVRAMAIPVLKRGVNLVILSIGAFADLDFYAQVKAAAVEGGAKVHLASGAIGGFDVLQTVTLMAQAQGLPETAGIETHTGAKGFRNTPVWAEHLLTDTEKTTVFTGNAKQAIATFPRRVNVAVATSLATTGPEITGVTMHSVPGWVGDDHCITAEIEGVKAVVDICSSTSAIAGWSAVSLLRNLASPVCFY